MSDISVGSSDSLTSVNSTVRTSSLPSLPSLENPTEDIAPENIKSLHQSNGIETNIPPSIQNHSKSSTNKEDEIHHIENNDSTNNNNSNNTLLSNNSNESTLSSPSTSTTVLTSSSTSSSSSSLPSDSELTNLLTTVFQSIDPTVATAKSIREQLETQLGISLHEKKKFISETLKRLVTESEDGTMEETETEPKEKKTKVGSNPKKSKKKEADEKEDEEEGGGSNSRNRSNNGSSSNKRKKEENIEEEEGEEEEQEAQEEKDRRLALDLQEELSGGRPRRSAAADSIARSNKRKQKFDAAAEGGAAKKLKPKKPPKLMSLSPALADFFDGTDRMSRGDVVRKMWDYIKAHSLQDPSDKRKILLDDRMKGVFGASKKSVTMFSMNKFLTKHIFRPEDVE